MSITLALRRSGAATGIAATRRGATPRTEVARGGFGSRARWLVPALLLLLLAAALELGASALREAVNVPIKQVSVNGDFRFLDKQQVEQIMLPHLGTGYFMVNLPRIRDELERLPLVQEVTVRRAWPDRLMVFINEQVPVLRFGTDGYLNPYAEVFRTGEQLPGLDLPMVDGPSGSEKLLLAQFDTFTGQLEPSGLRIRTLLLDGKHAWRMTLSNETEVLLGRRDIEKKVQILAALLQGALATDRDRIARMDLRYSNGVAIAWKNGAPPPARPAMAAR